MKMNTSFPTGTQEFCGQEVRNVTFIDDIILTAEFKTIVCVFNMCGERERKSERKRNN